MNVAMVFVTLLLMGQAELASTSSVRHFGALREMMHEGKVGPVADLPQTAMDPHAIGVGALSELRGEVTILHGKAWYSYPDGAGAVRTLAASSQPETAALLVVAEVTSWREIPLSSDLTVSTLESVLHELAEARGSDEAFPFLVEAMFPKIELHVIDGERLSPGASHEEHQASSVRLTPENVPATLVGFYSTAHQGIFTHHDRTTHVHAVVANPLVTGHVDAVVIPAGAILKVPR